MPASAADASEHGALGQHLSNEPPAAGANRGSDRHFVLPHARTREQEVGRVETRDQEHEQHRAGDDDSRLTDGADHVVEERRQRHLLAGVGRRIRRGQRRGQRLRFLAARRRVDAPSRRRATADSHSLARSASTAGARPKGIQRSTCWLGYSKEAGITPMTTAGVPLSVIERPRTAGSRPKRRSQSPSLSTTTDGAP